MIDSKVCTKCNVEKSISDYHKAKSGTYGVKAQCKKCVLEYQKKHYEPKRLDLERKRKEKKKAEQQAIGRVCNSCKEFKLFEFFSKCKSKKYGVESKCKVCDKIRREKYRNENREKFRASNKRWGEKNKEKKSQYTKKYRKENPEKIKKQRKSSRIRCAERINAYNKTPERIKKQKTRSIKNRLKNKIIYDAQKTYYCTMYQEYLTALCLSMKDYIIEVKIIKLDQQKEKERERSRIDYQKNRDKYIERQKAYYSKNLHVQVAKSKRRKAKKIQRTPKWANNRVINEFYELRQFVSEVSGIEYHVDHIVPLQGKKVSGLHVAANLQIIKAKDNLSKNANFNPGKHAHRVVNEQDVKPVIRKVL